MAKRRMILNVFENFGLVHHDHGQWTRPGAAQLNYASLDYWTDMARTAERGKLDGIFIVDLIGIPDKYENSPRAAVEQSAMISHGDPLTLVTGMAAVTKHLGFGVTVTTTYAHPYFLARTFNSLDHLTNGRIGWNIVTGYNPRAAAELGLDTESFAHDRRYETADEFLEVVYKLWEGSWEDGAIVRNPETGIFADPAKVHPIDHKGKYYHVEGIFPGEPSPQRTPYLYQAGASPAGRAFAVRHAEAIFIVSSTPEEARALTDGIRAEVAQAGRDPDLVKFVVMVFVVPGATDEEAHAKAREYRKYTSERSGLAVISTVLNVDLSQYDLDTLIADVDMRSEAHSIADFWKGFSSPGEPWTVRALARQVGFGGNGPLIIGGPETIADELERWMDIGGLDGFNLTRAAKPETLESFVDLVVPELQARGRVWKEYPEGTLREKMSGGSAAIPDGHAARRWRGAFTGKRSAADESSGG